MPVMRLPEQVTRVLPTLVLAFVALLFSSCAVLFVSPYDEVTDRAVTDLAEKTEMFFAKLENTGGGYAANKSFYAEARGSLQAVRLRAGLYQKNEGELREIDLLAENFKEMETLHRLGPLRGNALQAARSSIETNFRSIMQIELAKKRSGVPPPG